MSDGPNILVILSAGLGPFVQALGALAAVRVHHPGARITLFSSADTAEFALHSPYVDAVMTDTTRGWWDVRGLLDLRRTLRAENFARVYDLDSGARGRLLFILLYGWLGSPARRGDIPWSGDLPGTAFAHTDPQRLSLHRHDRWAAQLKRADITITPPVDLTWIARQVTSFKVALRMDEPFVLLVTDAPEGAEKPAPTRILWPDTRFVNLAERLVAEGLVPVLVGLTPAAALADAVKAACPSAVDLTGRTSVHDLVFLAWAAKGAAGCDNGLMHLFAAAGCRAVVLYDAASDPARNGQRGSAVTILRRPTLPEIQVGEVAAALRQSGK